MARNFLMTVDQSMEDSAIVDGAKGIMLGAIKG